MVEGPRQVVEWLRSTLPLQLLAATAAWLSENRELLAGHPGLDIQEASEAQLAQCSGLRSPSPVLLLATLPQPATADRHSAFLALDDVQDPGNVGTILRIADWFGISQVLLSPGCADPWNAKVVSAGMGAHTRVKTVTGSLTTLLEGVAMPVLAATLGGTSVYALSRAEPLGLIIGNEGAGISAEVLALSTAQVTIPSMGGAESLNAAVSAGILCSHLFGH